MNDKPKPPHVFANQVIKQMIQHALGDELDIEYDDYQQIRVAFRSQGGLWDQLIQGNIEHVKLLGQLVTAWGQMPNRTRSTDTVI